MKDLARLSQTGGSLTEINPLPKGIQKRDKIMQQTPHKLKRRASNESFIQVTSQIRPDVKLEEVQALLDLARDLHI